MSGKKYSDAERAAYWKAQATKGSGAKKTYAKKANTGKKREIYYQYKSRENDAARAEKERRRTTPGVISAGGSALGGALGSLAGPAGTALGTFLGGKLGHLAEQITGFGDYKVANNSIMKGGMTPPQVVNSMNKGGYIIRHREYIADISPSVAFAIQTIPLNPGLASSFPWLSQIAASFEEYKWRGLLFEFKSTSSDAILSAGTSTALGAVMMATQYNCLAPPFADKRTMENYEFANSEKPSVSFIHPVECKASVTPLTKLYVRSGAIPANSDQRLYDLGEFNLATAGMQNGNGVIGELWATYEIELYKNKYNPIDLTDHFTNLNLGLAAATPLGQDQAAAGNGSSLGGRIGSNTYFFPPAVSNGFYMFNWTYEGAVGAAVVYPSLGITNCVLKTYWVNGQNQTNTPQAGVTTLRCAILFVAQVTGQNASIVFGGAGTLPTSTPSMNLYVTQISNTMTA